MPGYESCMRVMQGLGELVTKLRLSTEVHVSEEELTNEIRREGGRGWMVFGGLVMR